MMRGRGVASSIGGSDKERVMCRWMGLLGQPMLIEELLRPRRDNDRLTPARDIS
jgi:hypothetical protein